MIDFETYHEVRYCRDELRLTPVQIAAKLCLEIKTVRKWLAKKRFEARKRPPRSSKLDPYKETIVSWLEKHPYSGMQILQLNDQDLALFCLRRKPCRPPAAEDDEQCNDHRQHRADGDLCSALATRDR